MGIYIKGMEMPTSCDKCPFLDYEEGFCFASGVKHESGWYESTLCPVGIKNGRHDKCPIVPVPSHGRLIEEEPIIKYITDGLNIGRFGYDAIEVLAEIKYAPTIIPAEDGE